MSHNSTVFGSKISFSCKNGKDLVGPKSITCLPTGSWSAIPPACERVKCPSVKAAFQDQNLIGKATSYKPGGKIEFSCPNGFRLRGAETGLCSHLGNWSLSQVPHCSPIHCPRPIAPKHGSVKAKGLVRVGESVVYECDKGFIPSGEAMVKCVGTGEWATHAPKCVTACTYPGSPAGGFLDVVKFYYKVGMKVTFSCQAGFKLSGTRAILCLESGHWSGPVPTCTTLTPPTLSTTSPP
eukprot:TRINITY_DN23387_c0_g1_i1.p1 TRINITY_DN23387_c0_g1~~TRINITY_DN23387_c0_g1_i1.p1  ORF type:complete len:272 (-),score=38.84 TRINITY_DN23387_c0_g1_i1:81-794(-)